MSKTGQNAENTTRPVVYDGWAEWDAFERLPPPIREALREAPFDYSAIEVEQAYHSVRQEMRYTPQQAFDILIRGNSAGRTDSGEISRMLQMIRQNIDQDMREYRARLRSVPRRH